MSYSVEITVTMKILCSEFIMVTLWHVQRLIVWTEAGHVKYSLYVIFRKFEGLVKILATLEHLVATNSF